MIGCLFQFITEIIQRGFSSLTEIAVLCCLSLQVCINGFNDFRCFIFSLHPVDDRVSEVIGHGFFRIDHVAGVFPKNVPEICCIFRSIHYGKVIDRDEACHHSCKEIVPGLFEGL